MAIIIEKEKYKVDEYLTQIRQGDSSALDPLYEETAKPLYSLCYTYMHNHHDMVVYVVVKIRSQIDGFGLMGADHFL